MAAPPIIPPAKLAAPTAAAPSVNATESAEKAKQTAEAFEAFFLSQVFEYMTAGLKVDKTFGGGEAESVYRSMQNEQLGKAMTKAGGVGVADEVYREMLKLQEAKK